MHQTLQKLKENQFAFEELVKRDFKQKYKGTVLGMFWSVLSPLLTLLVMRLVFTNFFGRKMEHYTTYLFAGNLMFSYFKEQTRGGMASWRRCQVCPWRKLSRLVDRTVRGAFVSAYPQAQVGGCTSRRGTAAGHRWRDTA